MKKCLKVCFCCLLSSLVLLGAVSLLSLTSSADYTFEIFWLDDYTIAVPYDSTLNNYWVWYSLDDGATWSQLVFFMQSDFDLARQDYYPVRVLAAVTAQYRVVAEYYTNPDALYTSNILIRSDALFVLVADDTLLTWDNVPDAVTYEVQYLNESSRWTTLVSFNRTTNYYSPDPSYSNNRFRIRVSLSNGNKWYSNTVTWLYLGVSPESFDISAALTQPMPDISGGPGWTITEYPVPNLNPNEVIKSNQVLASGIYNSKLGPYIMIAFGLMGGFAVVGYFVFRMH